jgi:hypothetical protein
MTFRLEGWCGAEAFEKGLRDVLHWGEGHEITAKKPEEREKKTCPPKKNTTAAGWPRTPRSVQVFPAWEGDLKQAAVG